MLCKGCGTCVAACPSSVISGKGFTDQQILAELEGILAV
jgi:heterodisulfide reductase subunit A